MITIADTRLAVIGLGHVGLPLAVEFGKKMDVLGFDINQQRVDQLISGRDVRLEVSEAELADAGRLSYSANVDDLIKANIYIVTVPTPIDKSKKTDLISSISVSHMLGKVIREGDVVIYESTVDSGATEEDCIPIIEEVSGLTFNKNFYAGYSPERITPDVKEHRVTTIKRVTSGSTPETADYIDSLYREMIVAGTYKASSIKAAEAARVIENTQRDINIALINEISLIFNRLHINAEKVLIAVGTKWNFPTYRPALVGGYCTGVNPYYLTHKAQQIGYNPEVKA